MNTAAPLENRAKFPLMVIDRVRERVGDDFLIEYRMSGSEEIEGGLTAEEAIEFAKMIDGKVDIIHVSAALDTEEAQAVHTHTRPSFCHTASMSIMPQEIKKHVKSRLSPSVLSPILRWLNRFWPKDVRILSA